MRKTACAVFSALILTACANSTRSTAELPDGRVWATNSVTLLALTPTVLRYAFTDTPGDPAAWSLIR